MLPQLRGRPLMLERHPDGVDGPRFMQENTPEHYPEWITRVELRRRAARSVTPCATTPPRWRSSPTRRVSPCTAGCPVRPGRPPRSDGLRPRSGDGSRFAAVRETAGWLRELLGELRLPADLMTTGSRGLHVVVPVDGQDDFDEVRAFARDVAATLAAEHPDRLTTAARKKDRGERLYLDVQRNGYAQTAVPLHGARAAGGARRHADQLGAARRSDLGPRRWTIADAVRPGPHAALVRDVGTGARAGPGPTPARRTTGS
ncbi:non-homologous end-joining DNA ligase LigD [Streptomyces sp. B21-106]|uniref:non-homologous end-joining DNA ligase LigD n=1 Tax=Streptomyces sp. B21-106 TaxID=3039418 RepID=UPI002FF065B9